MVDLLLQEDLSLVKLLAKKVEDREEREHIAFHLVKIFEEKNKVGTLIQVLVEQELREIKNPELIFPENSFAGKVLELYMRFVGQHYLQTTLSPILKKIYSSKKHYEIDTGRMEKESNGVKNMKNLLGIIERTLQTIFPSAETCPPVLRGIFEAIQLLVEREYSEYSMCRYTSITRFLFLRFFCPGLIAPKVFNIMEDHPDINATRILLLIAKTLQKMATFTTFQTDDDYLNPLNTIIEENSGHMKNFIDSISHMPDNSPPHVRPPIVLEKELAAIHRHLKRNLRRIKINQQDAVTVKKLEAILDNLEYISQHEKVSEDFPE